MTQATALLRQVRRLSDELELHRAKVGELSRRRTEMIRAAVDAGMSQAEVARELGISSNAVHLALMGPERRKQARRARRTDGAGDST